MDLLATLPDLEARLGRQFEQTADQDRALAVLEDATALVRDIVGYTIWTDSVTGLTNLAQVPGSVRVVVLRAAERAMRNPGGFSSESSGDYSYQRTGTVQPGVFLTEAEMKSLRKAARRIGLWTQPVTRGEDLWPNTLFLEDTYGAELFPVDVIYEE